MQPSAVAKSGLKLPTLKVLLLLLVMLHWCPQSNASLRADELGVLMSLARMKLSDHQQVNRGCGGLGWVPMYVCGKGGGGVSLLPAQVSSSGHRQRKWVCH